MTITRREWRWALVWSLFVVALTLVPYLNAAVNAPAGYTFSGLLVDPWDGNTYLAKMRQGYAGEWLFRLPFTSEDQDGIFVYTFYLGLGHLARLTGLPLIGLYHGVRVLSGLILLLTLYRLAAELTADQVARRWAFGLGAFASGLGFFSLLAGHHTSVDLRVPEANTFLSILTNPHFPLSFALEVGAILSVLGCAGNHAPTDRAGGNRRRWIGVLALAVALVLVAPYLAPAVWIAIGGALLVSRRRLRGDRRRRWYWWAAVGRAALLVGVMTPFLLYDFIISSRNPAIASWSAQALMASPGVLSYVLGFGILLPLAVVGAVKVWRDEHPVGWALLFWIGAISILVYAPSQLQRRFVAGVHVPLAVLAGIGLAALLAHVARWFNVPGGHRASTGRWVRRGLLSVVHVLTVPTNVMLVVFLLAGPNQVGAYTYLTEGESAALRWLDEHTTPESVVLAPPKLSNLIPGRTGARVVYGHPMETIDAAHKKREVEAYYHDQLDALETMAMFERYQVTYVVFDPREFSYKEMDEIWVPVSARLAYNANGVLIFELNRADQSR